jgi:hypothetical protein
MKTIVLLTLTIESVIIWAQNSPLCNSTELISDFEKAIELAESKVDPFDKPFRIEGSAINDLLLRYNITNDNTIHRALNMIYSKFKNKKKWLRKLRRQGRNFIKSGDCPAGYIRIESWCVKQDEEDY